MASFCEAVSGVKKAYGPGSQLLGWEVSAEDQGADGSSQDRHMVLLLICGYAWAHKGLWKLSLGTCEACIYIFFQFFN